MERHSRGRQRIVAIAACCCLIASGAWYAAAHRAPEHQAAESPATQAAELPEGLARSDNLEFSQMPLEDEAALRLEAYRDEGSCSLECAGYLDLYGNAWGCLVQGDGWVEIVVIRDAAAQSCTVQTIRLEAGT